MKMDNCCVTIVDIGSFRSKVILAIKELLELSTAEAREIVNRGTSELIVMPRWKAEKVAATLVAVGATVRVDAVVSENELLAVAGILSDDGVHCRLCGGGVLVALPGYTTKDEIRRFAITATHLAEKDEAAASGWIHPGVYCGNCGAFRYFEVE